MTQPGVNPAKRSIVELSTDSNKNPFLKGRDFYFFSSKVA